MVMAMEAWARFSTATSRFIHISDSHMQAMQIALATSKDVILFFSYSGSTKDMEDIMNIAKARGIPIILITHFPKSRAAECLFYGFCKRKPELYAAARTSTAEAITQKLL